MLTSYDNYIHPTALIENVEMGYGNYIGPYCVLKNCTLGNNNRFEAFCSIGLSPQHRQHKGEGIAVQIGDDNVFREFVTVHCGTKQATVINNKNVLYAKSHVGHDVQIGSHVTISNDVDIAGHCRVMEYANLAIGVKVHQFSIIPPGAFIGMGNIVTNADTLRPFHKYARVSRNTEFPNKTYFIKQGIITEEKINQLIALLPKT
jgi:UDP-N-acetylglucosamine acyltransferase